MKANGFVTQNDRERDLVRALAKLLSQPQKGTQTPRPRPSIVQGVSVPKKIVIHFAVQSCPAGRAV
jgi:hypothetical protein